MDEYPESLFPLKGLTDAIINAAISVHRELGPGFLEVIYENALVIELESRGHCVGRQIELEVLYRGKLVGKHRLDVLVDNQVVVELKSVEALARQHQAQLRSTLKAAGKKVGLLLNFNQAKLADGIRRVIA